MNQIKLKNWGICLFIVGAGIFFGIRLFNLINKHAVNVLFFDQWDFLTPLFANPSAWEMFTYQHGPHRQGLGLFVSKEIGNATNWDTRAECYGIGIILVLATILALILKKRLSGKLNLCDVLIPSIVLNFTQIEAVVLTPNPAHGAIPLLLILSGAIILTSSNEYLRYLGLVFITFFATYTGFGFFLGAVTPVILIISLLLHWLNKEKKALLIAASALLISVVSFSSFFINYVFSPMQDCFQLPHTHLKNYLMFISLELAMFVGFDSKSDTSIALTIGFLFLFGLILAALMQLWQIWKSRKFVAKNMVIFMLISFSLLFAFNSASGRICGGLEAAQTSRYMTLLIPCFLGLYFAAQDIPQVVWRTVINVTLIIMFIVLPVYALKKFNKGMNDFSRVKRDWASCYIEQESIEGCNKIVGNIIYPSPESTNMKEKLESLKQRHYNLFIEK